MWRVEAHEEKVALVEIIGKKGVIEYFRYEFPEYYTVQNSEEGLSILNDGFMPYRFESLMEAIKACAEKIRSVT